MSKHVVSFLVICVLATVANADGMQMPAGVAPARQHHAVSTTNAQAQAYFDQGLTLLYAFNRAAARHAFERAAAADPRLAMAQWGIAASYGSNINVPIDEAGERSAIAAVQRAQQLSAGADELDRAWIGALATRYTSAAKPDFAALDHAYARAMANLSAKYPDDLDAATLYAESLMDLRPWALYTPAGQPVQDTATIVATLESVMRRDPGHIGANHFYIHATEASTTPERGLIAATRLSSMNFEPAAAHLVHMPAHTYMRTGAYESGVMSNEHATQHDRAYLANNEDREASGYYQHNLTMLADAYSMLGNYAVHSRAAPVRAPSPRGCPAGPARVWRCAPRSAQNCVPAPTACRKPRIDSRLPPFQIAAAAGSPCGAAERRRPQYFRSRPRDVLQRSPPAESHPPP